jgi:hypothetical protein
LLFYMHVKTDDNYRLGVQDNAQLSSLCRKWPNMTTTDFIQWMVNRSLSKGVNHGKEPYRWLPRLGDYRDGPLDEYGRVTEDEETLVKARERATAIVARLEAHRAQA